MTYELPSDLYGRRAGRIAFGVVMIAGACVFVSRLLANRNDADAAFVLVTTWVVAACTAFVWRRCATRLARSGALRHRTVETSRLLAASLAIPSVGIALLLPLTLHLGVFALSGEAGRDFDRWAEMSLVAVGLAHIGFAVMVLIRATQLARGKRAIHPGVIYGIGVGLSLIPWGMFVLPPLLVAITGLPIVPLMFLADRIVARENLVIASAPAEPPRAIVVNG
jgi:hypothetical protein